MLAHFVSVCSSLDQKNHVHFVLAWSNLPKAIRANRDAESNTEPAEEPDYRPVSPYPEIPRPLCATIQLLEVKVPD